MPSRGKRAAARINSTRAAVLYLSLAVLPVTVYGVSGSVLDSFQLPWDNNGRVCQDLAWDGSYLWCVNSNAKIGVFELLKIYYDPQNHTGSVASTITLPGDDSVRGVIKGLAWDGSYLYLTYGGQGGRIYWLDPASPGAYGGYLEPSGLTLPYGLALQTESGTGYLWTVSNLNGYVYRVNKNNGRVVSSFAAGGDLGAERKPAGLTFDGSYIWISGFGKNDRFYGYTTGGSIVGTFAPPTARAFPTGLAWDGTDFWYVDACTDSFYRIRILYE